MIIIDNVLVDVYGVYTGIVIMGSFLLLYLLAVLQCLCFNGYMRRLILRRREERY